LRAAVQHDETRLDLKPERQDGEIRPIVPSKLPDRTAGEVECP
jgi:hypothetical protein